MCRAQRTEKKWRIKYIRNVIARVTRIKKISFIYVVYGWNKKGMQRI